MDGKLFPVFLFFRPVLRDLGWVGRSPVLSSVRLTGRPGVCSRRRHGRVKRTCRGESEPAGRGAMGRLVSGGPLRLRDQMTGTSTTQLSAPGRG